MVGMFRDFSTSLVELAAVEMTKEAVIDY